MCVFEAITKTDVDESMNLADIIAKDNDYIAFHMHCMPTC